MKINAVIAPRRINVNKTTFSQNKTTVTTLLIMISAVVAGTVLYTLTKQRSDDSLDIAFMNFTGEFINKSKPEIFSGLLLGTGIYLVLIVLFSTSVIGVPFIYSLTFLKMMGLGTLVSYIYSIYGLKGVEYCILIVLPGKFLLILGSLILTDSSVYLSRSIRQKDKDKKTDLRKQALRFLFVLIIMTLSVTVDFLTLTFFSKLFIF